MRKAKISMTIFIILIISACGGSGQGGGLPLITSFDVDFDLPEEIQPQEEIRIKAIVYLNDEPVDDAEEMYFDIWKHGEDDNKLRVDGTPEGGGSYYVDHTFDEEGVYYIIAHTTVDVVHSMPRTRVIVGDVSEQELEELEEPPVQDSMDDN